MLNSIMMTSDYPDTAAGLQYWHEHQLDFNVTMQKRPPAKRFPYSSIEWSDALQSNGSFVVVRGSCYLEPFKAQDSSTIQELPFPTLVCVLIKPVYYGSVKPGAKIFSLTDGEIELG